MKISTNLKTVSGKKVFVHCDNKLTPEKYIKIHFVDDRNYHIDGYNLLLLSGWGLSLVEYVGTGGIIIKNMDIDNKNKDILKVIGVDIIE